MNIPEATTVIKKINALCEVEIDGRLIAVFNDDKCLLVNESACGEDWITTFDLTLFRKTTIGGRIVVHKSLVGGGAIFMDKYTFDNWGTKECSNVSKFNILSDEHMLRLSTTHYTIIRNELLGEGK